MVHDLQIAQARRDGAGHSHEWWPKNDQRCMWCDGVSHIRRDCVDFTDALKNNVVYLWNGWVLTSETRRPLELNIIRGGMKRLMEQATTSNGLGFSSNRTEPPIRGLMVY